jgi:AraC-like DNA-binding protein
MDEINNVNALDAFLSGEPTKEPASTEPEPTPAPTEPEPAEPAEPAGGDPNLEPKPAEPAPGEGDFDKSKAAFAQMRVENSKQRKVITQLAKALDLDVNDPEALLEQLNALSLDKIARKQGVSPEELVHRTKTEEELAMLRYESNINKARESLLGIKSKYGLNDQELNDFAVALDKAGINLVANPTYDVNYFYYQLNGEKMMEARVNAAVEAALKNQNTARKHSATPTPTGAPDTDPHASGDKINTVSALDSLLNSTGK